MLAGLNLLFRSKNEQKFSNDDLNFSRTSGSSGFENGNEPLSVAVSIPAFLLGP